MANKNVMHKYTSIFLFPGHFMMSLRKCLSSLISAKELVMLTNVFGVVRSEHCLGDMAYLHQSVVSDPVQRDGHL